MDNLTKAIALSIRAGRESEARQTFLELFADIVSLWND